MCFRINIDTIVLLCRILFFVLYLFYLFALIKSSYLPSCCKEAKNMGGAPLTSWTFSIPYASVFAHGASETWSGKFKLKYTPSVKGLENKVKYLIICTSFLKGQEQPHLVFRPTVSFRTMQRCHGSLKADFNNTPWCMGMASPQNNFICKVWWTADFASGPWYGNSFFRR